jgi:curli biogenesis system outer membrane secretion channel CsgG
LTDAGEWELDEDKKLNFAVLNFKAGKGVEQEELDTLVDLITTNLVKTKLFNVMDRVIVNKVMNDNGGTGCADDSSKCKESANSIA